MSDLTHNEKVERSCQRARDACERLYPKPLQCPVYEPITPVFEKFDDDWPSVKSYLAEYNARWMTYLKAIASSKPEVKQKGKFNATV
jgi:hypothetical protein